MEDKFFLFMLRAAKHDVEKAKIKIDELLTMRTMTPEYFSNRDIRDEKVLENLRLGGILPILGTEREDSPRIIIMRCAGIDAKKYPLTELLNAATLLSDLLYEIDDVYRVAGVKIVADLSGFTMAHMVQCTIPTIRKLMKYYHSVMSVRVKGFYIINASSLAVALTNIIKMFLSKKLKRRFFIFSNTKDFAGNFPIDYLPHEYGGNAGKYDDLMENDIELIKNHWDNIKKWYNYGVDESKRSEKPKTSEKCRDVRGDLRLLEER